MSRASQSSTAASYAYEPVPPVVAVLAALDQVPASVDPQLSFRSALRLCVPGLCSAGWVELVDAEDRSCFLCWPQLEYGELVAAAGPQDRRLDCGHSIVGDTVYTPIRSAGNDGGPGFRGMLAMRYDAIRPGPKESLIGQLVVDRVVAAVHREQLRAEAELERARAEHLERALEHSREIGTALGILMSSQKCRSEQAFEQLRQVSQTTHRKIREIARDVIDTGTLETVT